MRCHSLTKTLFFFLQLYSLNPVDAAPTTIVLRALPGNSTNTTIPADAYPTSLANWTTPANITLSDTQRNPYSPSLDEIPLVNVSLNANISHSIVYNLTGLPFNGTQNEKRANPLLRLMPLGASITQGFNTVEHPDESTDIGYRLPLREWLRFNGWEVNMIGSKENGDFADNQNEGHPGYQIAAVMEAMDPVMSEQKPNLVLINAGTNDCTQADDPTLTPVNTGIGWVETAPDRMKTMIDKIFQESPGVTVILSTILPNFSAGNAPSYVNVANQGLRALAADYIAAGAKLVLAEMNAGWWVYPTDFSDVTHPTDAGYRKMAAIWAQAFQEVVSKGFLIDPIDTGLGDGDSSSTCLPSGSSFSSSLDSITFDVGANDGTYDHSSTLQLTNVWTMSSFNKSLLAYHQFHFAQLVSMDDTDFEARDELILILDAADRAHMASKKGGTFPTAYMQYRYNYGGGEFDTVWNEIDIVGQGTPECLSRGVRFGDVNGDGLDDFICINPEGSPFVSLNRGGSPPTFEFIGQIYSDRFDQAHARMCDIDGDGRLDYCGLDPDGAAWCHRNGGTGDAPISKYGGYWQGMLLGAGGDTFGVMRSSDTDGFRYLDINGDGRADVVFVNDDGSTVIYINQRGDKSDGLGLKPHWLLAGSTHAGFPDDTSMTRDNILFGRIYGSGRQDYIRVNEILVSKELTYQFSVWENTGSGGTKLNGDGVRFCDLDGDGTDDLIYIWGGGMVDAWRRDDGNDGTFTWTSWGRLVELAVDRKFVHFADWDGDGRCDILHVDKATGDVSFYQNYQLNKGNTRPYFTAGSSVVSGGKCPQGNSPSLTDLAVHFGDLDGDGRADYLCMDPDGRTVAWQNTASGGLFALNQIKVSVGFDRSNHRWADVNGDGRVDFIWVDKHTGNVQFWENNGFIPSIGSSMNWIGYTSSWIAGKERGQNIQFPRMRHSSKRADYQIVMPQTGRGTVYQNNCGDGGVGPGPDDGAGATDPGLPTVPDSGSGGDDGGDGGDDLCPRDSVACTEPKAADIAAANTNWPGVDWTATAVTCKEPSFSNLVSTHAQAVEMYNMHPTLQDAYSSTGFNRYFVQSTTWTETSMWEAQSGKYADVLAWAAAAPRPDAITQNKKITYYCKVQSWMGSTCAAGVGASTFTIPTKNPDCAYCYQVILCPTYWQQKNVAEITATQHYVTELPYSKDPSLTFNSREHSLIHEWFHNGLNDAAPSTLYHILDQQITLAGTSTSQLMYGPGITSQWAWQGFGTGSVLDGQITDDTMRNADNFAWMISYNWYEKAWGWTDDGRWKASWATTKRDSVWKRVAGLFSGWL